MTANNLPQSSSPSTSALVSEDMPPTVHVLPGDAQSATSCILKEAHAHVSGSNVEQPDLDSSAGIVHDTDDVDDKPIWYLAYGSNLNSKVFKGRRGIRPLMNRNVFVPGLELAFDQPGLPFLEPRFANARFVSHPSVLKEDGVEQNNNAEEGNGSTELGQKQDKHFHVEFDCNKPWTGREGALLGVAYLVSPTDFARILATEGGGSTYKMVAVDAYILTCSVHAVDGKAMHAVTGETIKAYTLVCPREKTRGVYGQASLRYLNLIRTGAEGTFQPSTLPFRNKK
jgi:hypothetical protein